MSCWDESQVFECGDMLHTALKEGKTTHLGRGFQTRTNNYPEVSSKENR